MEEVACPARTSRRAKGGRPGSDAKRATKRGQWPDSTRRARCEARLQPVALSPCTSGEPGAGWGDFSPCRMTQIWRAQGGGEGGGCCICICELLCGCCSCELLCGSRAAMNATATMAQVRDTRMAAMEDAART